MKCFTAQLPVLFQPQPRPGKTEPEAPRKFSDTEIEPEKNDGKGVEDEEMKFSDGEEEDFGPGNKQQHMKKRAKTGEERADIVKIYLDNGEDNNEPREEDLL